MKITDLKINPSNPRYIKDQRFEKLKKSLQEFPAMMELKPIIYDPVTMEVLGGNMRLRALIDLGHNDLPKKWVKPADQLTDEEKKRFIITDNLSFGEWDFETLANDFDHQMLEDWGMDKLPDIPVDDNENNQEKDTTYDIAVVIICKSEAQRAQIQSALIAAGYDARRGKAKEVKK